MARTVSVVIISHNEGPRLRATIEGVLTTAPRSTMDVVVVDDHSTDGSTEFLLDGSTGVKLVRPGTRMGIAGARNYGASQALGEILVFSDAHVVPADGWLDPLLHVLDDPHVGAVAPAIVDMNGPAARGYGFSWGDAGLSVSWNVTRPAGPSEVAFLCGCFLALRRAVFDRVGLFDAGLGTWGLEDAELCLRLWRAGLSCVVTPQSEVAHLFRKEFPYMVDWEGLVHNRLRVATVHFGEASLSRVVAHECTHAAFAPAFARLVGSDVWERRAVVQEMVIHDDLWFIDRFGLDAFQ